MLYEVITQPFELVKAQGLKQIISVTTVFSSLQMYKTRLLFLQLELFFNWKKERYKICNNTHPYYFPKRKKEKKESHPSSEGMQRCKGGEVRAVYIPLLLCQPGTYICCSFYFFWANNQHRHFRGGGRGYGGQNIFKRCLQSSFYRF